MTLLVEVDLTGSTPPYEQIRQQISGHVAAGRLRAGDRLPTIRALAADLGVAAGTVARAYRELELAGVVASRRRTGTVVTGVAPPPAGAVRDAAEHLVTLAQEAGMGDDDVLALVRGTLLAHRAPR